MDGEFYVGPLEGTLLGLFLQMFLCLFMLSVYIGLLFVLPMLLTIWLILN